ncbi:MAG: tetratricopeptide repeat protein [Bacteroidales bacterium]
MIRVVIIAFFLAFTQLSQAASTENAYKQVDSLLTRAQEAYNNGFYDNAIKNYSTIIDNGYSSTYLYYNLGNCYYKTTNYPHAILNYERAIKLDPNNKDAKINLQIVNTKIQDKIEIVPTFFLSRWWDNIVNLFPTDSWAIISVFVFIITLLFVAIFLLSRIRALKKSTFILGIIFLVLFILSISLGTSKYHKEKRQNYAIIMQPTITVKSSPTQNSVDLFVLHEGTKIQITENLNDWCEIRIENGSIGWIPKKSFTRI